jgi:N utilization substance protein A
MNGSRVNAIVNELRGEKIDIVMWSDDPAVLIENALSPAKVVEVNVNVEERTAQVIVPDYQLSLAIGREGQNARLAAKLTGYKIDIKSEAQMGGAVSTTAAKSKKKAKETNEYYDEMGNWKGEY